MNACPCGSGLPFEQCCGPYLAGAARAPTAEALMRSRYTAYALKDMAYVARTWEPSTRPASLEAEPGLEWLGLTVLSAHAGQAEDSEGTVEFAARYRIGGKEGVLREASRFHKHGGEWHYFDGKAGNAPHERKPGRNDPCPCGSGKKFKKCCGAT